jgi:hypothetical protein
MRLEPTGRNPRHYTVTVLVLSGRTCGIGGQLS